MTRVRTVAVVTSVCSLTIAAHAAMREFYDRSIEVAVTRIVRAELAPVRGDVARAHERIDRLAGVWER